MTEKEYNEKMAEITNWARETIAAFKTDIEAQLAAKDARIAELTERIRRLEYALASIITSAGECDVPNDGVGVPLVSVDHRLIEDARRIVNSPRKPE